MFWDGRTKGIIMEKLNTEKLNTKGVGTEEKTGELLKAITGLVDLQLMPVISQINRVIETFNSQVETLHKDIEEFKKHVRTSIDQSELNFTEKLNISINTITKSLTENKNKMNLLLGAIVKAIEATKSSE